MISFAFAFTRWEWVLMLFYITEKPRANYVNILLDILKTYLERLRFWYLSYLNKL